MQMDKNYVNESSHIMKTTKGWLVTPSEIDETCSKCSIYSQMKTLKIVALYLLPFSCYSLRKFCYKSPFWPSRIATLKMSMHVGWVIFTLRKGVKVCKLLLGLILGHSFRICNQKLPICFTFDATSLRISFSSCKKYQKIGPFPEAR